MRNNSEYSFSVFFMVSVFYLVVLSSACLVAHALCSILMPPYSIGLSKL